MGKKQREEPEKALDVKSRRGNLVSPVSHGGAGRGGAFYLHREAGGAPEGRAVCPQGRCRGSSYWGWLSLTWRTFQTQREDTISLSALKGDGKFSSVFFFFSPGREAMKDASEVDSGGGGCKWLIRRGLFGDVVYF